MADGKRTEQDLADIAIDFIKSLKPKGLTISELRKVAAYMEKAIDHITYGP